MELARYLGIDKDNNLWELMLILFPYEQIDHMQHLTIDLKNLILKLIITDRHIFSIKISSYPKKVEKASQ